MSSFAWAENDRVNSTLARRGNIAFTTLSMHLDATVTVATHIPGKINIIYDGLSRLLTPSELGLDSSLEYNASNDEPILTFLQFCDPDTALDTIESHVNLLRTLASPNDGMSQTLTTKRVWLSLVKGSATECECDKV